MIDPLVTYDLVRVLHQERRRMSPSFPSPDPTSVPPRRWRWGRRAPVAAPAATLGSARVAGVGAVSSAGALTPVSVPTVPVPAVRPRSFVAPGDPTRAESGPPEIATADVAGTDGSETVSARPEPAQTEGARCITLDPSRPRRAPVDAADEGGSHSSAA